MILIGYDRTNGPDPVFYNKDSQTIFCLDFLENTKIWQHDIDTDFFSEHFLSTLLHEKSRISTFYILMKHELGSELLGYDWFSISKDDEVKDYKDHCLLINQPAAGV